MDLISYAMAKKYSVQRLNHFGFNLNNALLEFRIALANRTATPCEIVCLGDSIVEGEYTSDKPNMAWASVLRKLLQSRFGDAGEGWIGALEGAGLPGSNPRVAFGTGWGLAAGTKSGFGGTYATSNGALTSMTVNFTGDKINIIHAKGSAGGTANVLVDGTNVGTINCNAATISFGNVVTFSGLTNAAHVLTITPQTSAAAMVEGVIVGKGSAGVRVHRVGYAGYKSGDWVNTNTQASWGVLPPHLTIIALGVNDGGNNVNPAVYKANMEIIIQRYQALGASVLLVPYGISSSAWSTSTTYNWKSFVQTMYDLARKYNCGVVDVYAAWNKDYTWAQTRGLYGAATNDYTGASGANSVHPGDKGHRYIAGILERHLI